MTIGFRWGAALFVACILCSKAFADEGALQDAVAIARAVDERPAGDRQIAELEMTLTDKAGRTRQRIVRTRSMQFEDGSRSLFVIDAPEDVRGTAVLSVDYEAGGRADDQWLYLPSLKKATRIASTGKTGSFLGSDLTYADITRQDLADYTHTMVEQDVDVDGEACWLIEARPANDRVASETGYVRSLYWISKARMMPVQAKHWIGEGRRLKYLRFEEPEQVDGIWTARRLVVRVMRDGALESTTVLRTTRIAFDSPEVTAEDFSPHRLEQSP